MKVRVVFDCGLDDGGEYLLMLLKSLLEHRYAIEEIEFVKEAPR